MDPVLPCFQDGLQCTGFRRLSSSRSVDGGFPTESLQDEHFGIPFIYEQRRVLPFWKMGQRPAVI